jgi:flagellar motor protein MotB
MHTMNPRTRLLLLLALGVSGCTQNPFQPGQRGAFWRQNQEQPSYMAQLQELDKRSRSLDDNNADLQVLLAKAQQQKQLLEEELRIRDKQLQETANQLESVLAAKKQAESKVETMQASLRQRGNATITANNSLKQPLTNISIPGLDVLRDGDVLRVAIPADTLFVPGSTQRTERSAAALDQVAQALRANFPRQKIVIESHTDSTTLVAGSATSLYQLSSYQALVVFQYLTQKSGLSERQLFMLALGPNEPKVSNGTDAGREKNRRIEIVIYPETVK